MDKDDFEQWRESPVTQWFMARLQERAKTIEEELRNQFWGAVAQSTTDWAAQQPSAAWKKGAAEALVTVTAYSFDDLEDKPKE
jgi:hypothetical protein